MSDAWRVASITSFEQVAAGPSTVLLRVAALSPLGANEARPVLVADDGGDVARFAAIPAPPDAGGRLRCAYSVPLGAIAQDTVCSLEFDDGFVIALPHPTAGAARLSRASAAAGTPSPPAATDPPEERRSELELKLAAQSAELAELRRQNAELRADVQPGNGTRAQTLHLHLEAAQAQAESDARRDLLALVSQSAPAAAPAPGEPADAELQTWSAELERRLAETTTELAQARAQLAERPPV